MEEKYIVPTAPTVGQRQEEKERTLYVFILSIALWSYLLLRIEIVIPTLLILLR